MVNARRLAVLGMAFIWLFGPMALAAEKQDLAETGILPQLHQGRKWRVGFVDSLGCDPDIRLRTDFIRALIDLGWIERPTNEQGNPIRWDGLSTEEKQAALGEAIRAFLAPSSPSQKGTWKWLVERAESRYLDFVRDGYQMVSPDPIGQWKTIAKTDILLTMGLEAALMVRRAKRPSPVVSLLTVKDIPGRTERSVPETENAKQIWVDPFNESQQIALFNYFLKFKRLGMVWREPALSPVNPKLSLLAAQRGFEILSCYVAWEREGNKEAIRGCLDRLMDQGVDALYLQAGEGQALYEQVQIAIEKGIWTFSQTGQALSYGVLMGPSAGRFYAERFARHLHSLTGGSHKAEQEYLKHSKIGINVMTARKLGYDPPVEVMGAADRIYDRIEAPVSSKTQEERIYGPRD